MNGTTSTSNSDSSRRSRWLCIAYAFPPMNRSGTHRTLGFVQNLASLGWDATVVTAETKGEPVDESLLAQVPTSTTVLRTPWSDPIDRIKKLCRLDASRQRCDSANAMTVGGGSATSGPREGSTHRASMRELVSRMLITPDSRLGWLRPAISAGMRAIRKRRPEVIYSTSPYASAHLIALILKLRTGLPWVADFRDPWRDNPFKNCDSTLAGRWDAWLERSVMRHATHVVCNTSTMSDRLCKRLPFVSNKCTTIMNGFDRERFQHIEPTRVAPSDAFVLTHAGQFYGPRKPTVWLAGLRLALARQPKLAGRIRLVLIGPTEFEETNLYDMAAMAGVGDHVDILGSISHAESLSHLAGSNAVILAGSAGPGADLQVPNKLFEYLAIRRPIIAALSARNPGVDVLTEAHADAFICAPTDEDAIADAMIQLAQRRRVPAHAWEGVDRFDRAHRAAELVDVFNRVAARSVAGASTRSEQQYRQTSPRSPRLAT